MSKQPSPYSAGESQPVAKIELSLDCMGRGRVVVNGVDLSNCVCAVQFSGAVSNPTVMSLDIHAPHLTAEIEAALRVYIRPETQEAGADRAGAEGG